MAPLRLVNATSRPTGSGPYYIYTADQPSRVLLQGGSVLHLQACDFLIYDAAMPLEWTVQSNYTTRSLLVEKELFHEYVPHDSPLSGRRLRFEYGVEKILSEIMDAAEAVTKVGRFGTAGPHLARAFLEMLTMMPPRDGGTEARTLEECVGSAADSGHQLHRQTFLAARPLRRLDRQAPESVAALHPGWRSPRMTPRPSDYLRTTATRRLRQQARESG